MFEAGQRVKVRTEDKAVKSWGRVLDVTASTEMLDMTRGGSLGGPPPDQWRTFEPGRTTVRVVIELEL